MPFDWVKMTNGQLDAVREAYRAVQQSQWDRETEDIERQLAEIEVEDRAKRSRRS